MEKNRMSSAAILLGTFRVKYNLFNLSCFLKMNTFKVVT